MAWNLGYPIDFAVDGDQTVQAIYKHIQEIAKIYKHLNSLNQKIMLPPQVVVEGVVNSVNDLPAEGQTVGENWVVDGVYHIWDGIQWVTTDPPSYADATEDTKGMVKLGTVDGVKSDVPSDTKVVTESIMKSLLNAFSPDDDGCIPGMIVMWYGMVENIPRGWSKCDGTNGTPDMRTRFPVAPADYSNWTPNDYGGANSIKLTVAQIPTHNHTFTGNSHDHSFTGISHDHTFTGNSHSHTIGSHSHTESSHYHSMGGHTHSFEVPEHRHELAGTTLGLYSHPTNSTRFLSITGSFYGVQIKSDSTGNYYTVGSQSSGSFTAYDFSILDAFNGHKHSLGDSNTTKSAATDLIASYSKKGTTEEGSGNTGAGNGSGTGNTQPSCTGTTATGTIGGKIATGTVGAKTATGSIGNTGSTAAIDNRPAYCELIFIMKLF